MAGSPGGILSPGSVTVPTPSPPANVISPASPPSTTRASISRPSVASGSSPASFTTPAAARRILHRYREEATARRGYLDGLGQTPLSSFIAAAFAAAAAHEPSIFLRGDFIVCHRAERSLSRRRPSSRPCVPSPRCTAHPCARAALRLDDVDEADRHADDERGLRAPSFTSSQSRIRAVGALPIANIASGVFSAAISMLTTARVTPRASAASRTSFSAMRQTTSTPKRAAEVLFIPAAAMFVSVTTAQPAARRAASTFHGSVGEAQILHEIEVRRRMDDALDYRKVLRGALPRPISAPIILMLSCSISSGLIMNTSRRHILHSFRDERERSGGERYQGEERRRRKIPEEQLFRRLFGEKSEIISRVRAEEPASRCRGCCRRAARRPPAPPSARPPRGFRPRARAPPKRALSRPPRRSAPRAAGTPYRRAATSGAPPRPTARARRRRP